MDGWKMAPKKRTARRFRAENHGKIVGKSRIGIPCSTTLVASAISEGVFGKDATVCVHGCTLHILFLFIIIATGYYYDIL